MNAANRIEVRLGDITRFPVDAIVNAANERMLGGGGVDGAIHAAAGPELLAECRAVPEVRPGVRCPTGEARLTGAHRLAARFVIHTVGPVWHGGQKGEPALLASCYRQSLRLAAKKGVRSVAFPAISTGVFGYPADRAAIVAVETVREFLETDETVGQVIFAAFDDGARAVLESALGRG